MRHLIRFRTSSGGSAHTEKTSLAVAVAAAAAVEIPAIYANGYRTEGRRTEAVHAAGGDELDRWCAYRFRYSSG